MHIGNTIILIIIPIPALYGTQDVEAGKKYFHQLRVKMATGFAFDNAEHF
jgi:hypothetical protein